VTEDVSEPRAGDQEDGVRDRVPGHDELEPGAGRVQVGVQGWDRHVHNGRVQHRHELPDQHDRQHGAGSRRPRD